MKVEIKKLRPVRDGEGVKLTVEFSHDDMSDVREIIISTADYTAHKLDCGEISLSEFDELELASKRYVAIERGLIILSHGDCSRRRLVQKLLLRKVDRDIAYEAVEYIHSQGYIDEHGQIEKYIRYFATKKFYGPRKITAELAGRGYDAHEAAAALDESGIDFDAIKETLLMKKFGRVKAKSPSEQRLMYSFLYRFGY